MQSFTSSAAADFFIFFYTFFFFYFYGPTSAKTFLFFFVLDRAGKGGRLSQGIMATLVPAQFIISVFG